MTVIILILGIMDQCTQNIDLIHMCGSVTYISWPSDVFLLSVRQRNIILRIMAQCDTKIGLINYMWQQCLLLSAGPARHTRQNSLTGPATFSGVKLDSNSS